MRSFSRVVVLLLFITVPCITSQGQGSVHGTVQEVPGGEPIAGVKVELMTKIGTIPSNQIADFVDADGTYNLPDIPNGEWRIRATYTDGDVFTRQIMTPKITVDDQTQGFHFRISMDRGQGASVVVLPLGFNAHNRRQTKPVKVTGKIEAHDGTFPEEVFSHVIKRRGDTTMTRLPAYVFLFEQELQARTRSWTDKNDPRIRAEIQSDGSFVFPAVPPGNYAMQISANPLGTIRRQIQINTSTHIEVKAPKFARSTIYILDADQKEIKNTVRTGFKTIHTGALSGTILYANLPAYGAKVRLLDKDKNVLLNVWPGAVNDEGQYSIGLISPGIYDVHIEYQDQSYTLEAINISVGQNELNFNFN